MTMVYASPPPRRARIHDSQAEVDTRIFVRAAPVVRWTPLPRKNVFLQPHQPSDPPLPWASARPISSDTLEAVAKSERHDETIARPRRRRRSSMPVVLFLAAFGLAFGVARDRELRAELVSELRITKARALAAVDSSAMELGRRLAEPR